MPATRALFLALTLAVVTPSAAAAASSILVLHTYGQDWPLRNSLDLGLQTVFREARDVTVFNETFEVRRFPEPQYERLMVDYLRKKYKGRSLRALVVVYDTSLNFIVKHRADLFPNVPIVALLTKRQAFARNSGITAVWDAAGITATVDLIRTLQPDVRRITMIDGALRSVDDVQQEVTRQLSSFRNQLEFDYLRDLPLPTVLERLHALRSDGAVVFFRQAIGNKGQPLDTRNGLEAVLHASPVPVYVTSDQLVGSGAVGGVVVNSTAEGEQLARIALQIVRGTRPRDIPPTSGRQARMFDWRQLKRWNLSERLVPADSQVLFREVTFWGQYRGYVIAAASLCLLQSLLIAGLLIQRESRRRAEQSVRESERALRASAEQVQDLAGRLIVAQENERRGLAMELHDDLSQRLALLLAELHALRQMTTAPHVLEQVTKLTSQMEEIGTELHRLSHELHPAWLTLMGLSASLRRMCDDIAEAHPIALHLKISEIPPALDSSVSLCLYRVAQEALHNVIKYSRATNVTVRLGSDGREIELTVLDDGVGFEPGTHVSKGIGLLSMRERVHFLGGRFKIRSKMGTGTRIDVAVPVPTTANEHTVPVSSSIDEDSASPDPQRPRVLVADDYAGIHGAIARMLTPSYHVVGHVFDGHTLLEETTRLRPDVVLLDMKMPDVNGIDACRQLKIVAPHVKVVMCTASDDDHLKDQALAVGASAFVVKLRLADDLLPAIGKALATDRS